MTARRIKLPPEVAAIYEAVDKLAAKYPDRKFTLDGHLVGSIGEVAAKEHFGLKKLYTASHPGHDAVDKAGRDVQVKLIGRTAKRVSMYATSDRLIVLRIVSPEEGAEIIYDGDGEPAWRAAGPMRKNGQKVVSLRQAARPRARASLTRPSPRYCMRAPWILSLACASGLGWSSKLTPPASGSSALAHAGP